MPLDLSAEDTVESPPVAFPEPPPPSWQEITASEKFQQAAPEKKLVAFSRWHDAAFNHASQLPDWPAVKDKFNLRASQVQNELQTAAGNLTPDEAKAKVAEISLAEANPQTPDDRRAVLRQLGGDVTRAYYEKLAPAMDLSFSHQALNTMREFGAATGGEIMKGLVTLANYAGNKASEPSILDNFFPDPAGVREENRRKAAELGHDSAAYWGERVKSLGAESKIDPMLAESVPATIGRAIGQNAPVLAAGTVGVPYMALAGAASAYGGAKSEGLSDDEAELAGVKSLIGLAAFGAAGKLAAFGAAKFLPEGASVLRTYAQKFLGGYLANEATTRALGAWDAAEQAAPGEKVAAAAKAFSTTPDVGTEVFNLGFAHLSALHKAPATPEAAHVAPIVEDLNRAGASQTAAALEKTTAEPPPAAPAPPPAEPLSPVGQIEKRLLELETQFGPRETRVSTPEEIQLLEQKGKLQTPAPELATPTPPVEAPVAAAPALSDPHTYTPALRTEAGEIITGEKGGSHADIKQRVSREREANIEEAMAVLDAEHGFVDTEGKFHTRDTVSAALGKEPGMSSQLLAQLQEEQGAKSPAAVEERLAAPPEPLAPAPVARPIAEPAAPPSRTEVSRAAYKGKGATPEQKAERAATGEATLIDEALQNGRVPSVTRVTEEAGRAGAKDMQARIVEKLAAAYPAEVAAEGSREAPGTKHPFTGTELPSIEQPKIDEATGEPAVDANGKPISEVRPKFTNDVETTAQQLDMNMRVIVPDDIYSAKKVNPAIHTTIDPKTGEIVVSKVDSKFGEISKPDEYSTLYREARQFDQAQAEVRGFSNEQLDAVSQNKLSKEELAAFEEEVDAHLAKDELGDLVEQVEDTAPTEGAVEFPGIGASGVDSKQSYKANLDTFKKNVELLKRIGVVNIREAGKTVQKSGDPVGRMLEKITADTKMPAHLRELARIIKDTGVDTSAMTLELVSAPNAGAAGRYYKNDLDPKAARLQLNLAQPHVYGPQTTLLHELVHHTTLQKLDPNYRRTQFEQRAYENLTRLFNRAHASIFEKVNGREGTTQELADFSAAMRGDKNTFARLANRNHYGLSGLSEFITESLTNPDFMKDLADLSPHEKVQSGKSPENLWQAVVQTVKEFFAGKVVAPDSLLSQALDQAYRLSSTGLAVRERMRFGATDVATLSKAKEDFSTATRQQLEEEMARRYPSETAHEMTSDEMRQALGSKPIETESGKIDSSGWMTPDNKFVPAPDGDHYEAVRGTVRKQYPKIAAELDKVIQQKGRELDLSEMYDFMAKKGFARVVHGGTEIYATGKMTNRQARELKNAAIEQGTMFWHDLGGKAKKLLYDPQAAFSLPADPKKPAEPNVVGEWIKATARRLFTTEGNLPLSVFRSFEQHSGVLDATKRDIAYLNRDLLNGLQKGYDISTGKRLTTGFSSLPKEAVDQVNQVLRGQAKIDSLPEPARAPVVAMRNVIDQLSRQLVEEGVAQGEVAARISQNFGTYLTRTYEVFDNPKWAKQIPAEVRNRAEAVILDELRKSDPDATGEQAAIKIDAMLHDWSAEGQAARKGARLGSQDFSTFIKRQNIAPELRELMGERTDPVVNFAVSTTKIAELLSHNRFLKDVLRLGKDQFLFEDGKQPEGFNAQVAAEGSSSMAPLNGLRTTPEIADAFKEFNQIAEPGALLKYWMRGVATAKLSKTVFSAMTAMRNITGQPFFFLANGHYDPRPMRDAIRGIGADTGAFGDTPAFREFYKRMVGLKIVGQSAKAGELRDIMREAALTGAESDTLSGQQGVLRAGGAIDRNMKRLVIDLPQQVYGRVDDFGRIVGFFNERATMAKAFPEMTPAELDQAAAQRIHLTYPDYSRLPDAIKKVRRLPFGSFMSFSYEALRTFGHNVKIGLEDLRSDNAALRTAGIKRVAGQLALTALSAGGVSLGTRTLLGMTADAEDDLRLLLPSWDKNAQLAYFGKGKTGPKYVNLSFMNPYSIPFDAGLATLRSGNADHNILTALTAGAQQVLQPFVSDDILASAAIKAHDVVYNHPELSFEQKLDGALGAFYNAFEPGTLTRARKRIIPAAKGESRHNEQLSLARELFSETTGIKAQEANYSNALTFKSSEFSKANQAAEKSFRDVALRDGTVSPEELTSAYQTMEGARFQTWRTLHHVTSAAIRGGVSPTESRSILKAQGLGADAQRAALGGTYSPYKPSSDMKKRLRELGRTLPELVSPYAAASLAD